MLNRQQNNLIICIGNIKNIYQYFNDIKSLLNEVEIKIEEIAKKNEAEVSIIKNQYKEGLKKVNKLAQILNKHIKIITQQSAIREKIIVIQSKNAEKIIIMWILLFNFEKNLEGRVDKI